MKHEIISEFHEIVVNVKLTDDSTPVISTSRGWEFRPDTLHALWVREIDGKQKHAFTLAYVELKGKLPKSGRNVNRTFWCELTELPEWIALLVADTAPAALGKATS